jgi:glutathione S-transferase
MLKLYDYAPSQNAWKVRTLLSHLGLEHQTIWVSIFEGESHTDDYLAKNPAGAVPVLEVAPGEYLAESNAILCYLAEGTAYLPTERLAHARAMQWLFFEQDYVQPSIATLRHWTMTGKLARRSPDQIEARRGAGEWTLAALERHLRTRSYLANEAYSIADIAVFAYTHDAENGGFDLGKYPAVQGWIDRVAKRPEGLPPVVPYAADPHSSGELH